MGPRASNSSFFARRLKILSWERIFFIFCNFKLLITVASLSVAHKSISAERNIQAITKVVRRLVILPLTSKSAQKAGHIYTELEKKGHPIGLRDTIIDGIALTRECNVATRNLTLQ